MQDFFTEEEYIDWLGRKALKAKMDEWDADMDAKPTILRKITTVMLTLFFIIIISLLVALVGLAIF